MAKKNILLVEDSMPTAMVVKEFLTEMEYTVIGICKNSDEAIAAVEAQTPDLILMDIILEGGIDGIKTSELILENHDVPIVYMTGANTGVGTPDIVRTNTYGYIQKPVDFGILKTTIQIAFSRFEMDQNFKRNERLLQLSSQVFELLNQRGNKDDVVSDIIFIIKQMMGYEAVAIRLKEGDHYPYYDSVGYSEELIDLSSRSDMEIHIECQGAEEALCYACVLDKVLRIDIDSSMPYYTFGGSFWTNSIKDIFEDCHRSGGFCQFKSMAIIPLLSGDDVIGVLQMNSNIKQFDSQTVTFFERISSSVGVTISRKKTYEQMIEAYERATQLEKIINRSPIVTFRWSADAHWKVVNVSDSIGQFGYDADDFYSGKITYDKIIFAADYDISINKARMFLKGDADYHSHQYRIVTKSGEVRWVEDHTWKEMDADGNVVYLQGLIADITDRHSAHTKVIENEQFLDSILKGMGAAIIIVNPAQKKVVDVNEQAEQLLMRTKAELLETPCLDILCGNVPENQLACEGDGDVLMSREEMLTRPDDTHIPVNKTIIRVMWKEAPHHVVIMFDISGQKELERQLSHAQKMESIGSLAAGIAHEINTPIQYVGDNLHFIKESVVSTAKYIDKLLEMKAACGSDTSCAELSQAVDEIEEAEGIDFIREEIPVAIDQSIDGVNKVARIVSAMKKFAHPGKEERVLTDINSLIETTITITKNEWKYVAEIEFEPDPDIPMVSCSAGDINQVILNMIVNASHAIRDVVEKDNSFGMINIMTGYKDGCVFFKIKDSGSGIPKEIQEKIFDPFFTTKEVGKGTGQGLSFVYTIVVDRHNGHVEVDSVVGEGATFTVYLPVEDTENQME